MAELGTPGAPTPPRRWRSDPVTRVVSLLPFALAVYFDFVAYPSGGGLFSAPPALLGLPLNALVQAVFLGWAAFCAWIVWTTSSRIASALAFVFGVVVSLFGIILGPALILIWQNIGA